MKNKVLVATFILCAFVTSPVAADSLRLASPPVPDFEELDEDSINTAVGWVASYNSNDEANKHGARMYVKGFVDALMLAGYAIGVQAGLSHEDALAHRDEFNPFPICIPRYLSANVAAEEINAYLKERPEIWDYPWNFAILGTLRVLWPCGID